MRLSHHAAYAALASLLWMLTACSKPAAAVDPVRAVRTIEVTADSAGGRLEFAAEVRARTETRLGFRVPGKLVQRPVGLGDSVRAGQLLAELDPQDLKLGQDSARAGLAAAQAGFDQAQADFGRYRELRDQGFISSAELERRDTALKAARAQLQQAQAQSAAQANQTSYARLLAGVAGVVTAVEAEPGMVLAAGAPVLRLAHDGPRDAVFSVPEDKVELVKALAAGAGSLSLRPWGNPDASVPAQVREIAAAADPVTRTFLIKADIGQAALRLGQTATVQLELPRRAGVTKLPLSALREEQGRTTVWVVDSSMTVRVQAVQLAGVDGNEAVVAAGLQPGQRVVTAGVHVLTPGQQVKLFAEPAAAR